MQDPTTWYHSIVQTLAQALDLGLSSLFLALPRILGAIAVFYVGRLLALSLKQVVIQALDKIRFSKVVQKTPVEHFFQHSGIATRVEEGIATVLYWFAIILVLFVSISILGISAVTDFYSQIILYIPRVISAVLVVLFAILLAGFVESVVKGAARMFGVASSRLFGKVASYLVLALGGMIAVSELGIARDFVLILFIGFVASTSLAVGLAFGLGSADYVKHVLRRWSDRSGESV